MSEIEHPAVAATRPAFEATGATIVAPDEAEALAPLLNAATSLEAIRPAEMPAAEALLPETALPLPEKDLPKAAAAERK